MTKKLDIISQQKKSVSKNSPIVDLRESSKKDSLVVNASQLKEEEKKLENQINKNKLEEPKNSSNYNLKKIQPIWWTIEEKHSFNSKLSIAFFILITIFLIVSIIQKNWIFSIILILGAVLFILYFLKPQKNIYRLISDGFFIDENFYSYDDIKFFDILKTPNKNFVIFETDKILNKHIFLPIKEDKIEKVKEFLSNFLKQKPIDPSFMDLLANIF